MKFYISENGKRPRAVSREKYLAEQRKSGYYVGDNLTLPRFIDLRRGISGGVKW